MFIEIKASKNQLSRRKLTHGIGVNDAEYMVQSNMIGKRADCPYYLKWKNMLKRCYSTAYQDKHQAYKGCSVSSEWLVFSSFKRWMIKQNWKGKELDKDLLFQGNKIYSSKNCLFVTQEINKLLISRKKSKGKYRQGVCFDKAKERFKAQLSIGGKVINIGFFDSELDASTEYKKAKYRHIADIAAQQAEPLRSVLLNYKIVE